MRIRTAKMEDEVFVREIAGEVFSLYGDYRPLLPKWFRVPGVMTFISEEDRGRTGYVMLAFFREKSHLVGDVLAIAVAPEAQNRGIGRMLLQHAVLVCEQASEHSPVNSVRLSVAHTNARARHLFESCGFALVQGDFGTYEGGQTALHMERPIPLPEPPEAGEL
jgi:ribosomal protein S18 acetylase RimI-like enzyme